jgi:DNA-binding CsgD family transcriptional regulator
MTHALDQILCRIAQRYASPCTPYEDLIQEARLAAWKTAQLPNAATVGFIMRAAKWAIFAYIARERREAHLSLERDRCNVGAQLTTPDFAPALIEVLTLRELCAAKTIEGQAPACDPQVRMGELASMPNPRARGDTRHPIPETLSASALSGAERTVLDWICRGLDYKEVAQTLECSVSVVKFHLVNIYRKLQCRNRIEAYNAAMRLGLVELPSVEAPTES